MRGDEAVSRLFALQLRSRRHGEERGQPGEPAGRPASGTVAALRSEGARGGFASRAGPAARGCAPLCEFSPRAVIRSRLLPPR